MARLNPLCALLTLISGLLIVTLATELTAQELHWDFEKGLQSNQDWMSEGVIFQNQPVRAAAVLSAGSPIPSNHEGDWLIHTFYSQPSEISCPLITGDEHTG